MNASTTQTVAERSVDVAIIGAGTAGLTARRAAKKAGASTVMIDPGPLGTTCARVGCMPSKLLIAAANAARAARNTERFGISVENVNVNGPAVMQRVQSERDRFVGFVLDVLQEAKKQEELIEGRAELVDNHTLRTSNGYQVSFKRLVIATGSVPFVPPPFRVLKATMLTNEQIFEIRDLPESLLVVGLGVIGLELGQAFARLGVRTTLLGVGGDIGPIADPVILQEAHEVLSAELDIHSDYKLEQIGEAAGSVRMRFQDSTGKQREEQFEKVLMAAGRKPNLAHLGLEHLGVTKDEQGQYPIDPDSLQLGNAPAFVAGDANELHPLLHEAADDGRIAGENAARFPEVLGPGRRESLGVVFSEPQIAVVGGGYRRLQNCEAVAGEASFHNQGRARVAGINTGKVRVYAEKRTGRLLGAEMIAPHAEHLAHLLAWSVQQGLTVDAALKMPFYHPVLEEGLRTALRNTDVELRHGAPIKCRVTELSVGS